MENMPKETAHVSPFEQIKHSDESGEFWSAREISKLLDYTEWRNFDKVVKRAMKACEKSNQQVPDHFVEVNKMVKLGSRAERKINNFLLRSALN